MRGALNLILARRRGTRSLCRSHDTSFPSYGRDVMQSTSFESGSNTFDVKAPPFGQHIYIRYGLALIHYTALD
jgi:hypothetical protein